MLVRLNFPLADGLSKMGPADGPWPKVAERLRQGEAPEQAFAELPQASPMFLSLVASALSSPAPGSVLDSLSRWLETADRVRAEARLALTYPLALVCCLLVEVALLSAVAVPAVLTPIVESGGALALLVAGGRLFGLALFVTAAALLFASRGDRIFSLAARVPRLEVLLRLVDQSLWARAMAALLTAGVPLPKALAEAPRTMVSLLPRERFLTLPESVAQGTHLSRALSELDGVDPHLTWAVAAGESQENLTGTLERAAAQLEGRLKAQAAMLLKLLEPFALVLVGGLTLALLVPFWISLYAGAQSFAP